ncbi:MAG: hypothetical protein ACFB15_31480 [Cyclobacteriaceae bacterium]
MHSSIKLSGILLLSLLLSQAGFEQTEHRLEVNLVFSGEAQDERTGVGIYHLSGKRVRRRARRVRVKNSFRINHSDLHSEVYMVQVQVQDRERLKTLRTMKK